MGEGVLEKTILVIEELFFELFFFWGELLVGRSVLIQFIFAQQLLNTLSGSLSISP